MEKKNGEKTFFFPSMKVSTMNFSRVRPKRKKAEKKLEDEHFNVSGILNNGSLFNFLLHFIPTRQFDSTVFQA